MKKTSTSAAFNRYAHLAERVYPDSPLGQGFNAAMKYQSSATCPHPPDSEDRDNWFIGWNMARRLNPQLAERPPRRMPELKTLLRYHGMSEACCVRCGLTDAIERAHIIDRSDDGLDNCANIAPLCRFCHAGQPIFKPEAEAAALAWFGLPFGPASRDPARRDWARQFM